MVIETRYRDIPWEEVLKCSTPSGRLIGAERWDREYRSKPVCILVPAIPRPKSAVCEGPHFRCEPDKRGSGFVCPHIAEIGDLHENS